MNTMNEQRNVQARNETDNLRVKLTMCVIWTSSFQVNGVLPSLSVVDWLGVGAISITISTTDKRTLQYTIKIFSTSLMPFNTVV